MIKTYMTTREVFATDNDPFMGVTVCQIANTSVKIRNKNIYNETLSSIARIIIKKSTRYEFNGMHLHGDREEMDKK